MLGRSNRFHGHQAVRRIYKQGRAQRGALGSLHMYRDPKRQQTRVAVVVSKKVAKSAVVRNRIRRRVYEQVRAVVPHFREPSELVFTIYQAEAAELPSDQLAYEVSELLKRAGLL